MGDCISSILGLGGELLLGRFTARSVSGGDITVFPLSYIVFSDGASEGRDLIDRGGWLSGGYLIFAVRQRPSLL